MGAELEALESALGYCFRNRALLSRAFTHKSRASEESAGGAEAPGDNEQLEFLGDAVLGFLVSEALVSGYPNFSEGRLSKCKSLLVSATHLHEVAKRLDLGRYLLLGRGEEMSGGRVKKALLANAVEALIAALYLDAGSEEARRFVLRHVLGDFDPLRGTGEAEIADFKSPLQELAQSLKLPAPRYTVAGSGGPEHSKTFTVEVRVGCEWVARAEGFSKKSAGQKAAQLLLQRMMAEGSEK